MGIQEYLSDHNIDINSISDDPIYYAIAKYKNHPSIIMINEKTSFESRFSFRAVNEDNIKRETFNLNSKKKKKKKKKQLRLKIYPLKC